MKFWTMILIFNNRKFIPIFILNDGLDRCIQLTGIDRMVGKYNSGPYTSVPCTSPPEVFLETLKIFLMINITFHCSKDLNLRTDVVKTENMIFN